MEQQRIDAPARVVEAVKRTQETIERLNAEVQAALFGAHAALDVPSGWQWDGRGWAPSAPEVEAISIPAGE